MPCPPSKRIHLCCLGLALAAAALPVGARAQGSSDPFSTGRGMGPSDVAPAPRVIDRLPIFFPPNPPPLGRALGRTTSTPARWPAPPELNAFVNEPFYPPLGTRMATKTLSPKLKAELDRYRAAKLALQNELQTELNRLRTADKAARADELAALARKQMPKIVELEKAAEQLRRDLINGENTWSAVRQWRLGDSDRRGFSPLEIAEVMRGYAYYQNGLLPAQRRLLREISIELQMAGDSAATATANQPYLFFPPEPARVLLPDDVPPEVSAKLAVYQTRKSQLKKELYDAVYTHDGQKLAFLLGNSLKSVASRQAGRLAELEKLAEDIRQGLAQMAEPEQIAERSPLPAALQQRVNAMIAAYLVAQREASTQIDAIIAAHKALPMQATYRFDGDGLKTLVIPSNLGRGGRGARGPALSPETNARIDAVRQEINAIADGFGRQMAEVINQRDAIRAEIVAVVGTSRARQADQAFVAAMRVATAKETEDSYRDYRIALFQPGLSPEQRRLLFDRVLEQLELPLPRGELQPLSRGSSW